jgi:hypothetical protein
LQWKHPTIGVLANLQRLAESRSVRESQRRVLRNSEDVVLDEELRSKKSRF